MKPQTTEDVFDLMDSFVTAAAVGTAMELGLFWLLEEGPMDAAAVAKTLQIPTSRCNYWLQQIQSTGLLERGEGGYRPTSVAKNAILGSYSQATWAFLARESRERFPAVNNLTEHIRNPGSSWEAQGLTPPDYIVNMVENPERAAQFTRMLFELHQELAEAIAENLDLSEAERLLDLGGGSGVISHAFLRRYPKLTSLIVDIPNVCAVGREIAKEEEIEARLTYLEADFIKDELPRGYDVILQCDVGVQDEEYLRKLHSTLDQNGRLVLVEQYASEEGFVPDQYKVWAFLGSMSEPDYAVGSLADLNARLERVGFQIEAQGHLFVADEVRFSQDWVMTEARKE